jgi:plastocyanin
MRTVVALLAVALLAVAFGACGSDEGEVQVGSEEDLPILRFETPPGKELAFTTKEASTEAGKVVVEFNNPQLSRHRVVFEDSNGKIVGMTDRIFSRATATTIDFEPGEYTFFCSLGAGAASEGEESHREAGMEGTLTVE